MHTYITRPYRRQIRTYLTSRAQHPSFAHATAREREWLIHFFRVVGVRDIRDIRREHVSTYIRHVHSEYASTHSYRTACRALGNFFAYWHARHIPCLSRTSVYQVAASLYGIP